MGGQKTKLVPFKTEKKAPLLKAVDPRVRHIQVFVESPGFNLAIISCVLVDVLFFCLEFVEDAKDSITTVGFLSVGGLVILIFIVEMVLKLWCYGCGGFFAEVWNIFDFFIVVITIVGYAVEIATVDDEESGSSFGSLSNGASVLRLLRLARVLRLVRGIQAASKLVKMQQTKISDVKLPALKCIEILVKIETALEKSSPLAEEMGAYNVQMEDVRFIVTCIQSNRLYTPNLQDGNVMDKENAEYLNSHYNVQSRQRRKSDDEKKEGGPPSRDRSLSVAINVGGALNGGKMQYLKQGEFKLDHLIKLVHLEDKDSSLLKKMADSIFDWEFDIFECARLTNNRPVVFIGMWAFKALGLIDEFRIKEAILFDWLGAMEIGYRNNPYHNNIHAADVLQGVITYIRMCGLENVFTPLEVFSCVVGAIIHDYQHPGVNNKFLVNTGHSLAVQYNDISVLEAHHVASAWKHTTDEKKNQNIFQFIPEDDLSLVRETIITIVLNTDMAFHFKNLGMFKSKLQMNAISQGAGDAAFNLEKGEDRKLLLEICLHCSDIGNPARSFNVAQKWSNLVMKEFYAQGDEERHRKMKVSVFMDRFDGELALAKCQKGFIEFVVRPLYEQWCEFLSTNEKCNKTNGGKSGAQVFLSNMSLNHTYWSDQVTLLTEAAEKKKENGKPGTPSSIPGSAPKNAPAAGASST